MSNKSWIYNLCKKNPQLAFTDLVLPASHNSHSVKIYANRAINRSSMFVNLSKLPPIHGCVAGWAINQHLNLETQLERGVRVIDIDASYDTIQNEWVCEHSYFISTIEQPLRRIKFFLDTRKDPVILNLVARENVRGRIDELDKIVTDIFGKYILHPQDNIEFPIKSTMLDTGKKLIIVSNILLNKYWKTGRYAGHWVKSNAIDDAIVKIQTRLDGETINNANFTELSWILTPTTSNIVKGLCCCFFPADLQHLMNNMNSYFALFFSKNKHAIKKKINIIAFDFITSEIIQLIISCNDINSSKNYFDEQITGQSENTIVSGEMTTVAMTS